MKHQNLPLVYSCSGCSSATQLANRLALMLDRDGHADHGIRKLQHCDPDPENADAR